MWNDLTMSERANVIKMAVKAGLRDMNSIRKFYDDSLKYADGGPKVTLVDNDKVRMSPSGIFSDERGNIIGDSVVLPEVSVRPTTPQTNNSFYYQQWLMRQANRGGRNMSLNDREAYNKMMRRIANQNEVNNFTGFDGTIYNHGNGALEQVSPEFDILTLGRQFYTDGLFKSIGKNASKKVSKKTPEQLPLTQWTPEQWTAAQDVAIARGDMAEAQRLRDLHFQVSAPNTKVNVPLWTSSEEAFNSFDLSHFGETDSGFFGYGHYLTPMEKYAATYHPINRKFYVNMENPYIGSNDQYFNRIQYVKDILAKRKENIMRNLRDGKLTRFSNKLGINENTSLEDAEHLVDKYIKDETVKWNNKYVKYADEFEGKDGVLSWREIQGIPNKQEGIYKEVVVPKGEQIKLADAVTYDDNGVRIPLGLRDNFKNKDIRYGLIPLSIGGTALGSQYAEGGSIHIAPSKRGTFTAAATKHGMGVQEFASKVLANKDNYSPAMVKKANFAKNTSKWKHDLGGYLFI